MHRVSKARTSPDYARVDSSVISSPVGRVHDEQESAGHLSRLAMGATTSAGANRGTVNMKVSLPSGAQLYRGDEDLRRVHNYMIGIRRDTWTHDRLEILQSETELANTGTLEQKSILAKQQAVKRPRR